MFRRVDRLRRDAVCDGYRRGHRSGPRAVRRHEFPRRRTVRRSIVAQAPVDVAWTSDHDLWAASRPVEHRFLAVGDTDEGLLNSLDTSIDYLVNLEAGAEVEVWARTPQGDVDVTIVPPDVAYDFQVALSLDDRELERLVDSGEGLYGYDVREPFVAERSGVHRFKVFAFGGAATVFRFTVSHDD
ncbi:MAG: hypothetical protein ACT4OX_02065 [Actinomycetota bacterium]